MNGIVQTAANQPCKQVVTSPTNQSNDVCCCATRYILFAKAGPVLICVNCIVRLNMQT